MKHATSKGVRAPGQVIDALKDRNTRFRTGTMTARDYPDQRRSSAAGMGNLTGLLARLKPAISATRFTGEKSSKNAAYVDAVARTNVVLGLESSAGAVQSWQAESATEPFRLSARCTT
jgi:hypothetical protein